MIMSHRQITFSTPRGRGATLTLAEPVTPELVDAMGAASALILRALHDGGPTLHAGSAGEAEYASWFRDRAGDAEYASWLSHLRH